MQKHQLRFQLRIRINFHLKRRVAFDISSARVVRYFPLLKLICLWGLAIFFLKLIGGQNVADFLSLHFCNSLFLNTSDSLQFTITKAIKRISKNERKT